MNADYSTNPKSQSLVEALWRLQKIILDTLNFEEVVQRICDGLLTELGYLELGYRIIVLTLIDDKKKVLKRISLSQTPEAARAMSASVVPFEKIEIPLSAEENLLIKTINEKRPQVTHHWWNLFSPVLTSDQARANQEAAGIKTSMLYPVILKGEPIGVLIFSLVKEDWQVSDQEKELIRSFTDIVGLAVQNSRLYSNLAKTSQELEKANERLKELDKLKDEFVSLASHELKTPMTAIKSYIWMALAGKGGELTEKQRYYLDRSYSSTERLIKLVNNMLNISRIESGRISIDAVETDLCKLINETIAEIKPRADELGLTISFSKTNLPTVLVDQDKIKEVIINFIGNSLKFTPRGGLITISNKVEGEMVITEVVDNGQGIEIEDQKKLFQKFGLIGSSYTTNQAAAQGTGLGLYISKAIVDLHGGKIWSKSEGRGKGATFGFSLKKFNQKDFQVFKDDQSGKEGIGIIHNQI